MFLDPWLEMHFQLGLRINEKAAKRVPRFDGWKPEYETKRAALYALMSPDQRERAKQIDAQLEAKRRRRGPFQIARWN